MTDSGKPLQSVIAPNLFTSMPLSAFQHHSPSPTLEEEEQQQLLLLNLLLLWQLLLLRLLQQLEQEGGQLRRLLFLHLLQLLGVVEKQLQPSFLLLHLLLLLEQEERQLHPFILEEEQLLLGSFPSSIFCCFSSSLLLASIERALCRSSGERESARLGLSLSRSRCAPFERGPRPRPVDIERIARIAPILPRSLRVDVAPPLPRPDLAPRPSPGRRPNAR